MPTKDSAAKALRQDLKRGVLNLQRKRAIKELTKATQKAIASKSGDALKAALEACRVIDKAVQKGTLHANTGARKKSRLMKQLKKITAA